MLCNKVARMHFSDVALQSSHERTFGIRESDIRHISKLASGSIISCIPQADMNVFPVKHHLVHRGLLRRKKCKKCRPLLLF